MKHRPLYLRILEDAGVSPEATRNMTDAELLKYRRMGRKALSQLRAAVPVDPALNTVYIHPVTGAGFEEAAYQALLPLIQKLRGKGISHARIAAKIVNAYVSSL